MVPKRPKKRHLLAHHPVTPTDGDRLLAGVPMGPGDPSSSKYFGLAGDVRTSPHGVIAKVLGQARQGDASGRTSAASGAGDGLFSTVGGWADQVRAKAPRVAAQLQALRSHMAFADREAERAQRAGNTSLAREWRSFGESQGRKYRDVENSVGIGASGQGGPTTGPAGAYGEEAGVPAASPVEAQRQADEDTLRYVPTRRLLRACTAIEDADVPDLLVPGSSTYSTINRAQVSRELERRSKIAQEMVARTSSIPGVTGSEGMLPFYQAKIPLIGSAEDNVNAYNPAQIMARVYERDPTLAIDFILAIDPGLGGVVGRFLKKGTKWGIDTVVDTVLRMRAGGAGVAANRLMRAALRSGIAKGALEHAIESKGGVAIRNVLETAEKPRIEMRIGVPAADGALEPTPRGYGTQTGLADAQWAPAGKHAAARGGGVGSGPGRLKLPTTSPYILGDETLIPPRRTSVGGVYNSLRARTSRQLRANGLNLRKATPEELTEALGNGFSDEAVARMRIGGEGHGKFTLGVARVNHILKQLAPEATEADLHVHDIISSVFSNGADGRTEGAAAGRAWLDWMSTGDLPIDAPPDHPWAGGHSGTVRGQMGMLREIFDKLHNDPDEIVKWFRDEHPAGDLQAFNPGLKLGALEEGPGGGYYGCSVLGPKIGSYAGNRLGIPLVTKDRWFYRAANRLVGYIPRNAAARDSQFMSGGVKNVRIVNAAVKRAAQKLGLTEIEIKELVFAGEKRLY